MTEPLPSLGPIAERLLRGGSLACRACLSIIAGTADAQKYHLKRCKRRAEP